MTTVIQTNPYQIAHEEFKTLRRLVGISEAVSQWCRDPFAAWLESLEKGTDLTTETDRMCLTVAMNIDLTVRDALIITMLDDPQVRELDPLLQLATTRAEAAEAMRQLLDEGFKSTRKPDQTRVKTIASILMHIGEDIANANASNALLAQPLAILAYIQWWNGMELAAKSSANLALEADSKCTLASLVYSLVMIELRPRSSRK